MMDAAWSMADHRMSRLQTGLAFLSVSVEIRLYIGKCSPICLAVSCVNIECVSLTFRSMKHNWKWSTSQDALRICDQVEALFTDVSMQGCSNLDHEKEWDMPRKRNVSKKWYWDTGDIRKDIHGEYNIIYCIYLQLYLSIYICISILHS